MSNQPTLLRLKFIQKLRVVDGILYEFTDENNAGYYWVSKKEYFFEKFGDKWLSIQAQVYKRESPPFATDLEFFDLKYLKYKGISQIQSSGVDNNV